MKGVEKDYVMLLAARASRTENQDTIYAAMVGMLADPKEVLLHNTRSKVIMLQIHRHSKDFGFFV